MKILVDARSLGTRPSGIGIYIFSFVRELARHEDVRMHLVTDVAESVEMKSLRESGRIEIHTLGRPVGKNLSLFSYYRFIKQTIHKLKPDIFWEGNSLVPVNIRNPYGKFVVTIHDMFPISMPECYGRVYPHYFKWGVGRTIALADAVIYISKETKRETERYFPKAREIPDFISYIIVERGEHNAPRGQADNAPVSGHEYNTHPQAQEKDIHPLEHEKNAHHPKQGDNHAMPDRGYFLYIGNLERRKGTDILLDSYLAYRKMGGDKQLVLAGKFREKPVEDQYRRIAKDVGGLYYAGYVSGKEKEQLLEGCDAFLFPSRAEGFGIPVIEALLYDKPVLVSDLPIFTEIAGDAVSFVKTVEGDMAISWAKQMLLTDASRERFSNPYTAAKLGDRLYEYFTKVCRL